jgi:hypothetical protein
VFILVLEQFQVSIGAAQKARLTFAAYFLVFIRHHGLNKKVVEGYNTKTIKR